MYCNILEISAHKGRKYRERERCNPKDTRKTEINKKAAHVGGRLHPAFYRMALLLRLRHRLFATTRRQCFRCTKRYSTKVTAAATITMMLMIKAKV